ncbi:hypothetical protein Mapa_011960 [Marchantia paleacea]|nr:hypothetical protein Mapa_011960 [Marchantia paleacea]
MAYIPATNLFSFYKRQTKSRDFDSWLCRTHLDSWRVTPHLVVAFADQAGCVNDGPTDMRPTNPSVLITIPSYAKQTALASTQGRIYTLLK